MVQNYALYYKHLIRQKTLINPIESNPLKDWGTADLINYNTQ